MSYPLLTLGSCMGMGLIWDEHPFATCFDVHQGYRVLTHSHIWFGYTRIIPSPKLHKRIRAHASRLLLEDGEPLWGAARS